MLLIRSRSTDVARVLDRQQVLRPRPGPSSICAQLRPAARRRRRACCVGLHSTNFSPISDCGPDDAARVGAEVLVARVVDPQHDRGLEVRRDLDVLDRADLDAGDLDVLARDHEAGVVEDRAHAVGVVVVAGHDDERHERGDAAGRRRRATRGSHGPGGTSLGIAVERAARRRATAPSRRRRAATRRPGSGAAGWSRSPSKRCDGGIGREHAARRVVGERERVEDRLDARVVAVGVVVGGALAEVAEPADELGRVRAQELEHRLGFCERLAARA